MQNNILSIVFGTGNFCKTVISTIYCWKLRNLKVFLSQGSAAKLTGRGGQVIYHFVANLFRNIFTKYHQNRLTFVQVIVKVKRVKFFFDHIVYAPNTISKLLI